MKSARDSCNRGLKRKGAAVAVPYHILMAEAPDKPNPTYKELLHHKGDFTVVDDANETFTTQWLWAPSVPTRRETGITGWMKRGNRLMRLHVCATTPCGARYPPNKYIYVPPPIHARLVAPAPLDAAADASPPVGATATAASPQPSPASATPQASAFAAPEAVSGLVEPAVAGLVEPAVAGLVEPAVAGLDTPAAPSETAGKYAVAPPPAPLPKSSAQLTEDAPPPERAALPSISSAAPLPPVVAPVVAPVVSAKEVVQKSAVVEPDDLDEAVVVHDLTNAEVAREMNAFLLELQADRKYVGLAVFVIFALRYRLRVQVWYGSRCEDVLAAYAPWANDAISDKAPVQAVCSNIVDRDLVVVDNAEETNHWVAAIPCLGEGGSGASFDGSEGESEATALFHAIYLSLGLDIEDTVRDGDCGLDVLCLMLNWARTQKNRSFLRSELAAFALTHIGNRAFIAMMRHTGEINAHLGLYELDAAGAELLAGPVQGSHHGDGGAHHGDGDGSDRGERSFSDEEIRAVTWKCRLQKASPEFVHGLLSGLPEACRKQMVQEYQNRPSEATKKDKPVATKFLISRDALVADKVKSAQSFLKWCEETKGPLAPAQMNQLKIGKMPYGLFASYVKAHPPLQKACGAKKTTVIGIIIEFEGYIAAL